MPPTTPTRQTGAQEIQPSLPPQVSSSPKSISRALEESIRDANALFQEDEQHQNRNALGLTGSTNQRWRTIQEHIRKRNMIDLSNQLCDELEECVLAIEGEAEVWAETNDPTDESQSFVGATGVDSYGRLRGLMLKLMAEVPGTELVFLLERFPEEADQKTHMSSFEAECVQILEDPNITNEVKIQQLQAAATKHDTAATTDNRLEAQYDQETDKSIDH